MSAPPSIQSVPMTDAHRNALERAHEEAQRRQQQQQQEQREEELRRQREKELQSQGEQHLQQRERQQQECHRTEHQQRERQQQPTTVAAPEERQEQTSPAHDYEQTGCFEELLSGQDDEAQVSQEEEEVVLGDEARAIIEASLASAEAAVTAAKKALDIRAETVRKVMAGKVKRSWLGQLESMASQTKSSMKVASSTELNSSRAMLNTFSSAFDPLGLPAAQNQQPEPSVRQPRQHRPKQPRAKPAAQQQQEEPQPQQPTSNRAVETTPAKTFTAEELAKLRVERTEKWKEMLETGVHGMRLSEEEWRRELETTVSPLTATSSLSDVIQHARLCHGLAPLSPPTSQALASRCPAVFEALY
ncbi:unnamed protein product [Jaminaea pallidilutea]